MPETAAWLKSRSIQELTVTRYYCTEKMAQLMAQRLIGLSCWFEVMPYPDDWWHFTLKNEWGLLQEVDRIANESLGELNG
jgi:hypothetical protein